MHYIGIDPGRSGAIAVLTCGGAQVYPFEESAYVRILSEHSKDSVCCLEHVHAMPGQGVNSMFSFGENFGYIRGLLEAFRIPYQLVSPQRWKNEFGVNSDKATSIAACRRLFPDVSITKPRGRKPNDGMAEALLMAEYARRHF